MKIKIPKKFDASDRKINDLIFEANKRKCWAYYFKNKGNLTQYKIHIQKHKNAVKALKSLGYEYKNN